MRVREIEDLEKKAGGDEKSTDERAFYIQVQSHSEFLFDNALS